jgi:sporulation protein YlmC with PRC-barrel domain
VLVGEMLDRIVYSKDMSNLGKVKDIEFDPSTMTVMNVIVEFRKEAAKELLGKKIVLRHAKGRVPVASIESMKDAVNLKLPWKELKGTFKSL